MMVVALGITMAGDKKILGFVQTATENEAVLRPFLQSLLDRELDISRSLLAVTDGAKGSDRAPKKVFDRQFHHPQCQWHKCENVVSSLPKADQLAMRKRLQAACQKPAYSDAKRELLKIQSELEDINQSAANNLAEGLEETLTLHRLGVFPVLGLSFKTTHCLESINSIAQQGCAKVDYRKNSSQKLAGGGFDRYRASSAKGPGMEASGQAVPGNDNSPGCKPGARRGGLDMSDPATFSTNKGIDLVRKIA